MLYTVQDAFNELIPKLGGTTLGRLKAPLLTAFNAGRLVIARIDPKENVRITQFTQPFYDNVYDYALPDDLKDDAIIDIRTPVRRSPWDDVRGTYEKTFDIKKLFNSFVVRYNNNLKTLRINKRLLAPIVLAQLNSLTGDGVITTGGDLQNLGVSVNNFVTGGASLQFDLNGATGQGFFEIALTNEVNLSTIDLIGALFDYIYLDSGFADFQNVNLRWGQDSGNYWERTVSQTQINTPFQQYWQLLRFDWENAPVTGAPDPAHTKYVRLTFNYTIATVHTGICVDNLTAQLGTGYEIEYYSEYLYKDAITGLWKPRPTSMTDIINLGVTSFNMYVYELACAAIQELKTNQTDLAGFRGVLDGEFSRRGQEIVPGAYTRYAEQFPTQRLTFSTTYWNFGYDDSDTPLFNGNNGSPSWPQ